MSVLKVVLDTNLLVSILLGSKSFTALAQLIRSEKIRLIISPAQIAELTEVLHRPKFNFSPDDICSLLNWIKRESIFVTPNPLSRPVSRDPKDDFLLAAAVSGSADAIITGDSDLLVLREFHGIPIFTVSKFIEWVI